MTSQPSLSKPNEPRRRVWAQNASLMLFGTIAALLIAEGVCRVTYTKPWHLKLIEQQKRSNRKSNYRQNELGLRDRNYPPAKPANSTRVLILGDSFTFGAGVAEPDIFPQRLERELNRELAAKGRKVEILNGGIGASLTHQWVRLLNRTKETFQPDVILIVFFLRDGTKTHSLGSFFQPIRREMRKRDEGSSLYRYSYLYRVYREGRDRLRLSREYSKALNVSYFGDERQTAEWKRARKNLLKIKKIGERNGAQVALVVFPILVELNEDYPFKGIVDTAVGFGEEQGFPTLDLLPAFMGSYGPSLWVSSFDQHPNSKGHEIAANAILPFLRDMLTAETADGIEME